MPKSKRKPKPTAESFTLATLRERKGWSQPQLADAAHRSRTGIALLEAGRRKLKRDLLYELTGLMGYSRPAVDVVLFAMAGLLPFSEEVRQTAGFSEEEVRELRAAACRLGLSAAHDFEEDMLAATRARRHAEAKERVAEVSRQLRQLSGAKQRAFLEGQPLPMLYALVEWLCDESQTQAASDPFGSLHPASLAFFVAEFAPEGRERSFLQGWALAFVGNARRAMSDLPASDEEFNRSGRSLRAAAPSQDLPLPLWRPLDLEASLRRVQRLWDLAIGLHRRALEGASGEDRGPLLVNLAFTLERMGDSDQAIDRLEEARPLVDASRQLRLVFAHRFNLAVNLVHVGKASVAEGMLSEIRGLAIGLRNELDVVRVVWLAARIAAALGRREEALLGLAQARRYFTAQQIAYDAAEVALEEALLLLEVGDHHGAKTIAGEIAWIFEGQRLHEDALAAMKVFHRAAQLLKASADLVRELLDRVRKAPHHRVAPR